MPYKGLKRVGSGHKSCYWDSGCLEAGNSLFLMNSFASTLAGLHVRLFSGPTVCASGADARFYCFGTSANDSCLWRFQKFFSEQKPWGGRVEGF